MIIAVTGHRPDKLGNEWNCIGFHSDYVCSKLQEQITLHAPSKMISGMALGVDTIFAQLAISNNIPLIAALPFEGQEVKWSKEAQDRYFKILANPLVEKVYVGTPGYSASKMHDRNHWMVDNCDLLLGVWDGTPGGTYECLTYAEAQKRRTIIITPL